MGLSGPVRGRATPIVVSITEAPGPQTRRQRASSLPFMTLFSAAVFCCHTLSDELAALSSLPPLHLWPLAIHTFLSLRMREFPSHPLFLFTAGGSRFFALAGRPTPLAAAGSRLPDRRWPTVSVPSAGPLERPMRETTGNLWLTKRLIVFISSRANRGPVPPKIGGTT